jgi:hypothetical protein
MLDPEQLRERRSHGRSLNQARDRQLTSAVSPLTRDTSPRCRLARSKRPRRPSSRPLRTSSRRVRSGTPDARSGRSGGARSAGRHAPAFASGCDRPPRLRRRASRVRSGTHRQECLNPTGIRGYRPRSAPRHPNHMPPKPLLIRRFRSLSSRNRTQEVGGSSPPRSISRTPAVEPRMARRAGRELSASRPGVKHLARS